MIHQVNFLVCIVVSLCVISLTNSVRAEDSNDEYDALLNIANTLLQGLLGNNQAGGQSGSNNIGINEMAGIAQAIGSLMKNDGSKSTGDGSDGLNAAQVLAGLSQLMNANGGASETGDFDLAKIGNLINVFTSATNDNVEKPKQTERQKRRTDDSTMDNEIDTGAGSILNIAAAFMNNTNNGQANEAMTNLLPMAIQLMNSFGGVNGDIFKDGKMNFQWILQSLPEEIKVLIDQFANPELLDALWQKSNIEKLFDDFNDRDGNLDYEKFLKAFSNQAYRRRWIKSYIGYISEWFKHLANPSVYKRYSMSTQIMYNGILTVLEAPPHVLFDPNRPTESIAKSLDFLAHKYLHKKISTIDHVKPAVAHIQDLMELVRDHEFLQQLSESEFNDKMADIFNLEIIEPFLKVLRAYRFASHSPQCDKYVLCKVNSHKSEEKLHLAGFKDAVTRVSSMAAAWFLSNHTGTPFWTLLSVMLESHNCKVHYRPECSGFNEGEESITIEYVHNEL